MYHSISAERETGHPYFWINTPPERFAEQMQFLRDNGYRVINLEEAIGLIKAPSLDPLGKCGKDKTNSALLYPTLAAQHPEAYSPHHTPDPVRTDKYVVLTFDDGYRDFYTKAFPILEKFRFDATVFLPTGFIAEESLLFKGRPCMCWEEVRGAATSGIRFGSHTVTHSELKNLTWNQVEWEVRESKEVLEERTGLPVESFSYPYAFPQEDRRFTASLREQLVKYGYTSGMTTTIGTARKGNDELFLKRIPINSHDDSVLLRGKLEGQYDWVRGIQYGFKLMKKIINRKKTVRGR
jgi:peptidoglycan/xylan/chitin deacetylase (PgdA/CDA1 family)